MIQSLRNTVAEIQQLTVEKMTVSSHLDVVNAMTCSELRLSSSLSTNQLIVTANASSSDVTLSLPSDTGTDLQVLQTDGTGVLAWGSAPSLVYHFATRVSFVSAISQFIDVADGTVVAAEGISYVKKVGTNAISDLPDFIPYGDIWVDHFGAVTTAGLANTNNSTLDNGPAINAAITYVGSLGGGRLYLKPLYYRIVTGIRIDVTGIVLVGANYVTTHIISANPDGPVIIITVPDVQMYDLDITSTTTAVTGRLYATRTSTNCGIRIVDEALTGSTGAIFMIRVYIKFQPFCGMHASSSLCSGRYNLCYFSSNNGHGVIFDDGATHVSFNECQFQSNQGSAIILGNVSDTVSPEQASFFYMNNCEIANNNKNNAIGLGNAQVYLHAVKNIMFMTAVLGGNVDGVTNIGMYIAGGQNIHLENMRYLSTTTLTHIDSLVACPTIGVYIRGFDVVNSSPFTTNLDSAVVVTNTTGDASLDPRGIDVMNYNFSGGLNSLVKTGIGMDSGSFGWRVPDLSLSGNELTTTKTADQTVTNSTTLVEDIALRAWVRANADMVFTITLAYTGPPESDLKLQVQGPTGSTIVVGPSNGIKIDASGSIVATTSVAGGVDIVVGSDTSVRTITLVGGITNGSTDGVVGVWWAQNTSNAGDTVIKAYSSFITTKRVVV